MSDEQHVEVPQRRAWRPGPRAIVVLAAAVLLGAGVAVAGLVMTRDLGAESTAVLQGTVTQGPVPAVQAGGTGWEPVSATVVVTRASDGKQVATVRSNADGHYSVKLAPGSYLVTAHLDQPSGAPDPRPVPVTLRAAETSTVNLRLDSGIRF